MYAKEQYADKYIDIFDEWKKHRGHPAVSVSVSRKKCLGQDDLASAHPLILFGCDLSARRRGVVYRMGDNDCSTGRGARPCESQVSRI